MSRASSDIRVVSTHVADLQEFNPWAWWSAITELKQNLQDFQSVALDYTVYILVSCFLLFFFLLGSRMLLRRQRIRHYSQGK